MKYVVATVVVLAAFTGCAKSGGGGGRGPSSITRQVPVDHDAQREHVDPAAPVFGQQR